MVDKMGVAARRKIADGSRQSSMDRMDRVDPVDGKPRQAQRGRKANISGFRRE
jgi:hypothetical protein